MGNLRILMTADAVGGVFTYVEQLLRSWQKEVEVHLVFLGLPPSKAQRAQLTELNVTVHDIGAFKLEWMDDPWEDLRCSGERLLKLAERIRPDLVHLNQFTYGKLPFHAPCVVVGHSCVLSWHAQVRDAEREPWQEQAQLHAYAEHVREGIAGADAVVAPTPSMLRWLNELYGPIENTRLIWNGRNPLSLPQSKRPVILTAGRVWDEAKNIAALVRVAPELAWPTHVAGANRLAGASRVAPDSTRAPVAGSRAVEWLGPLSSSALAERLGHSAIFALPARYEPFGLAPLEAGLAGCALVLGDVPTLREVWAEAALYVSSDDDAELRAALTSLIESPTLLVSMQAKARARASHFTAEKMAAAYLRLYAEVLKGEAAREGEVACAS